MPVKAPLLSMVQPLDVCKVIALLALSLTPSMMSISPSLGQFGPIIQLDVWLEWGNHICKEGPAYNAGHVPDNCSVFGIGR